MLAKGCCRTARHLASSGGHHKLGHIFWSHYSSNDDAAGSDTAGSSQRQRSAATAAEANKQANTSVGASRRLQLQDGRDVGRDNQSEAPPVEDDNCVQCQQMLAALVSGQRHEVLSVPTAHVQSLTGKSPQLQACHVHVQGLRDDEGMINPIAADICHSEPM